MTPKKIFFTLIGIIIIGTVGSVSFTYYKNGANFPIEDRLNKEITDIKSLEIAIGFFKIDNFRIPTEEEGLEILTKKIEKNQTAYIDKLPLDSWGQNYRYKIVEESKIGYLIYSLGQNGEDDSCKKDDICHWLD